MSNTPTDKELEAFAIEEQFLLFCDVDEFTQIARAVLAKWAAPQPAPAPLSDDAKDAARYRWLRNKSTVLHGTAWLGSATAYQRDVDFLRRDDALAALDAAIDAAIAAQGGRDAG
jgi:hypothetical protein